MNLKHRIANIKERLKALGAWLKRSLKPGAPGDFTRHRRYKVSIERSTSLSTVASVSGSKMGLILGAVGVFIVAGCLWLVAFIYTPLRNLLPAKFTSELRDKYADMSVRLDSVAEATRLYENYASNLASILTDSLPPSANTGRDIPDIQDISLDSIIGSSDAERLFVKSFEDAERFNLSVLSPIAAEGMTFFSPVTGVTAEPPAPGADIPSVSIAAGSATPVSAIYRGTVINMFFSTGRGTTIVIQHPNEFVSIYSGLAEVFVKRGDKVNAGTRLGLANSHRYPLSFELWHNGTPLDATEYISF